MREFFIAAAVFGALVATMLASLAIAAGCPSITAATRPTQSFGWPRPSLS
jgi:hypothetical protein